MKIIFDAEDQISVVEAHFKELKCKRCAMKVIQTLHYLRVTKDSLHFDFNPPSFFNTYGKKEWSITIKPKLKGQSYTIDQQQLILPILLKIDQLYAEQSMTASERGLRTAIFRKVDKYFRFFERQGVTVARYERFIIEVAAEIFGLSIKPESYRNWRRNQKKKSLRSY